MRSVDMKNKFVFLLALSIMLAGCASLDNYFMEEGDIEPPSLDYSNLGACEVGECTCMVCKNYTPWWPLSIFYESSLEDGECDFRTPCTESDFLKFADGSYPETITMFMIGQGGSFAEFNDANPYCNNSLKMPVKWVYSGGPFEYPIPDAQRARCFLEKGAIPVYLLYSEGVAVDPARAENIAEEFDGVGPVILTAEMNFNSSNPEIIENVSQQIIGMKMKCPNCLIALSPSLGDYEGVKALMSRAGVRSSVDIVAFGIDSRNFSTCNPATIYLEALNFSQFMLYEYNKPSLWAYMLFDQAESADGSCTWDATTVSAAYGDFYNYLPAFVDYGVIGAAPYSLYGQGPLDCANCSMMINRDTPEAPVQGAWFSNCQRYYTSRGVMPIVYSDKPGTKCSFGGNYFMYTNIPDTISTAPEDYESVEPMDPFYRCDACVYEEEVPGMDTSGYGSFNSQNCDKFPEIDYYADLHDLDPAFVRSIIAVESGFNECAVGVSENWYPTGGPGYGTCAHNPPILSYEDIYRGICPSKTAPSGGTLCSWGLMQTFVPPEYMWADHGWLDDRHNVEMALACAGDEEFNPLYAPHSVCQGTHHLSGKKRNAQNFVAAHETQLVLSAIRGNEELYDTVKKLDILYFTVAYYKSTQYSEMEDAVNKFYNQRTIDSDYCNAYPDDECCASTGPKAGPCCNNQYDFPSYAQRCLSNDDYDDFSPVRTAERYQLYFTVRDTCGYCDKEGWLANLKRFLSNLGISVAEPTETSSFPEATPPDVPHPID